MMRRSIGCGPFLRFFSSLFTRFAHIFAARTDLYAGFFGARTTFSLTARTTFFLAVFAATVVSTVVVGEQLAKHPSQRRIFFVANAR
jgi:hypothetical protein